jgi:anti-sigma factor RsiW
MSARGRGVLVLAVALAVRVLLSRREWQEWLGKRIEISTPINQWMRGAVQVLFKYSAIALVH